MVSYQLKLTEGDYIRYVESYVMVSGQLKRYSNRLKLYFLLVYSSFIMILLLFFRQNTFAIFAVIVLVVYGSYSILTSQKLAMKNFRKTAIKSFRNSQDLQVSNIKLTKQGIHSIKADGELTYAWSDMSSIYVDRDLIYFKNDDLTYRLLFAPSLHEDIDLYESIKSLIFESLSSEQIIQLNG